MEEERRDKRKKHEHEKKKKTTAGNAVNTIGNRGGDVTECSKCIQLFLLNGIKCVIMATSRGVIKDLILLRAFSDGVNVKGVSGNIQFGVWLNMLVSVRV